MIEKKVTITNKLGLHARASAKLIRLTGSFASRITILYKDKTADGKSIMDIMVLGAAQGSELTVQVCGEDEQEAIHALCALIENKFDEES